MSPGPMTQTQMFDVIIAGGAVMGSAAAFWLTRMRPGLRVAVVERDPSYAQASTALSVASIRQQFSSEINVKISRFGIDFIRNISDWLGPDPVLGDLGLRENGYLFLAADAQQAEALEGLAEMQRANGAATRVLAPDALAARFPWLSVEGLAAGSFGARDEGWFDNMGLMRAFAGHARRAGAVYITGEVRAILREAGQVVGVTLASGATLKAPVVVNAAGTRAAALMQGISQEMPVEPRKRTVFLIDAPNATDRSAPLLIDPSGFYLRPEGAHWLVATVAPQDDHAADPDDFDPDLHDFEDVIWERLYARAPCFDAVKVIRAWAGHYAYNTVDQNALIGAWPGVPGLYVMNGFSGHGLQQAPAVGRGIAELILTGRYDSLDLSPLGPERLFKARGHAESAIV